MNVLWRSAEIPKERKGQIDRSAVDPIDVDGMKRMEEVLRELGSTIPLVCLNQGYPS